MSVILGVAGGFGHDAAAALVVDGSLVALMEEERLTRKKHAPGEVPYNAMIACLNAARLDLSDIDTVSIAWDSKLAPGHRRLRDTEERLRLDCLAPKNTQRYSHHLCHAASAAWFHPSKKPAIILVVDGRGEQSSTSVFRQDYDGRIVLLEQSPIHSSLGSLYAAVTHFTGCGVGGQGKSMALAAFGNASHRFDELIVDGLQIRFQSKGTGPNKAESSRVYWHDRLCQIFGQPRSSPPSLSDLTDPQNRPRSNRHADATASTQLTLESVLIDLIANISHIYPGWPILMSGGVALNCSANKALRRHCPQLLLNPIPHDAGTALGAALLALREETAVPSTSTPTPYLGQEWNELEVRRTLNDLGISAMRTSAPIDAIVDGIIRGAAVGWFDGRAEAGPRALGHRSILASATKPGIAGRMNTLKGREPWRPFGPSVLDIDATRIFNASGTPYMIEAIDLPDRAASLYPNIAHIDQTTRPQTVGTDEDLATYRNLLHAIRAETGAGVVLNTSYNVDNEPIVNSPTDAIHTFYRSAIDMLYLSGTVLVKDSSISKRW